ncbi:uncharacterized protein [Spinacia oleracea]|uniref:Endonuclease/exonuclease/phosphatase domain-containing protein n=1 Tax=Spinacia oleracea TaxID=3562 RepID=A0ABM3QZB0_SPIOL|nr:uncharacterized protein LOC130463581 [Spinacia oleracea]
MVSSANSQRLSRVLGYDNIRIVNPEGHCGGMWVCWNEKNIDIQIVSLQHRIAHLVITDKYKKGGCPSTLRRCLKLQRFAQLNNANDIPPIGSAFSWKKHMRNYIIYERLDRCLANDTWLQLFPHAAISYEYFSCSDHTPVCLYLDNSGPPKLSSFRFQNAWTLYEEAQKLVAKNWAYKHSESRFFCIFQKLSRLKTDLKNWHSRKYGNIQHKLALNQDKLKNVEVQLQLYPENHHIEHHLHRLVKQRERLLSFGQNFWGKYARKQWLTQGDRGSRFFHEKMKTRKRRSQIFRLQNDLN